MSKHRLVISNMYRAKNKVAFFAIHQALTRFSELDLEFHILWDDIDYKDKWTEKINNLDCKIIPYTKNMLDQYCLDYGISEEQVAKFSNFNSIYFILHAHYLKKNNIADYYLIYDDDIVIKEDIEELLHCLKNNIPCLLSEPLNPGCDKSIANKLDLTARVITKEEPIIKTAIGTETMKDEEIADNAFTVFSALLHAVPNEIHNIKSMFIKLSMGPVVEITNKGPVFKEQPKKPEIKVKK